ncbi:molybdopterin-dependent oxidoreductase [Halomonas aquamarina]|uniref:Molybdopterin-dependent oxidoreductase n=1 Tax=Vreelandella aquamarina TaxID=77097 RepID=A0ACC5VPF4_9GAMM|nr:molybdopterin-dependent oxidoreductase [Halomonas aquamarina]MBZ5486076.1 molybdopterin-dependent oxidoreductase [Halomonas aquamarina]
MIVKTLLAGWALMALCVSQGAQAAPDEALPAPDGAVILEVKGNIKHQNAEGEAHLDMAMLKALPQHGFDTSTPWTGGVSHYSGPLMRDLLEYVGAESETVQVSALNGYAAEIPMTDFDDYEVILALERNGEPMPIREYGPLWVLYPFDQDEVLLSEKIRFRAVWQVMRIDAL